MIIKVCDFLLYLIKGLEMLECGTISTYSV